MAGIAAQERLRTGSLRWRTVVAVLALLALLLLALAVTVELVLGARLRAQVEERLADRASAAAALLGTIADDDLASRLSAQGVAVLIIRPDGDAIVAGPSPDELRAGPADIDRLGGPGAQDAGAPTPPSSPPSAPAAAPTAAEAVTVLSEAVSGDDRTSTLTATLSDGTELMLTAGTESIGSTLASLRVVLISVSAAFLLVAAGALVLVVRRTLRPLERMTDVARSIARGDRGRRLRPTSPTTEIGLVASAFDEMLEDLEEAEKSAVASEARMRSFVSDAAHELRTPIAGIQSAADALVRADGGADDRERLTVHVVRESLRAGRLVQDLLLMARLDDGLPMRSERIDPVEAARAAVERQLLREAEPAVELVADDHVRDVVVDPDRLGQILGNLLENAARFAASRVEVRVDGGADADSVRILVTDDGPGVASADRERIFDRLVRLDEGRDRAGGGSGLGLPIARGLARALGGELDCVDHEGGARFRLVLRRVGESSAARGLG